MRERGDLGLFLQNLKVVGHHQDVVDVVALAGVIEDTNDIGEIRLLVTMEKVLSQVKGLEDEADMLLVLAGDGNERIEADADLRAGGIDDAQIVQPAGGGNQGQQLVIEEFALALAVDDDQRDFVTIALGPVSRTRSCWMMFSSRVVLPAPVMPKPLACMTRTSSGQSTGFW